MNEGGGFFCCHPLHDLLVRKRERPQVRSNLNRKKQEKRKE
jgi:hypothetical protein